MQENAERSPPSTNVCFYKWTSASPSTMLELKPSDSAFVRLLSHPPAAKCDDKWPFRRRRLLPDRRSSRALIDFHSRGGGEYRRPTLAHKSAATPSSVSTRKRTSRASIHVRVYAPRSISST